MTQKDEKRKKLQTLAVQLIDKTLKQEKGCEKELDHEVHAHFVQQSLPVSQ